MDEADQRPESGFTYRDLRLLSQASVLSPLRVIALIDFDCFYAQCESVRLGLPEAQPLGVQQFLHVISTNYPARAAGLKKVVTAVEAKKTCPNIVLQHVPTWREGDTTWAYRDDVSEHMGSDKSSLDYYRLQSRRAFAVVKTMLPRNSQVMVEKAGIDEFFMDLSSHVYQVLLQRHPELLPQRIESLDSPLPRACAGILDWQSDVLLEPETDQDLPPSFDWDHVTLNIGAEFVRNLRKEIYDQLHYTCSGGLASNKVLAKLAAGRTKPNGQTVLLNSSISNFLSTYKFTSLRGLGGKLGQKLVTTFATESLSDLLLIKLPVMQAKIGHEAGLWVFQIIRGFDYSVVTPRTQIQSILSQKTFSPAISGLEQAERWLLIFAGDIMSRLEDEEGRRPTTLTVHHHIRGRFGPARSKQIKIPRAAKLDRDGLATLARKLLWKISEDGPSWPCLALSLCVSNFIATETTSASITSFLTSSKDAHKVSTGTSRSKRKLLDETMNCDSTGLLQQFEEGCFHALRKEESEETVQHDLEGERDEIQCNPSNATTARRTSSAQEGMYLCPNCAETIAAADVLEHLDWHVAKTYQDQL